MNSHAGTSITLDRVKREFGDGTGLHETSATINAGEFIAVLGPSGCGKSTLLRCIAGLERPDSGTILFNDTAVFDSASRTNVSPNRRGLSMVFQDLALWPHMTVKQNVAFPLINSKLSKAEREAATVDAMHKVGIEEKADMRPRQLSGGQQQRVAIARALVNEPQLLLMDEPLSALDANLREHIRAEITQLTRRLGLTVIYVTHDQSEALAMADRIIVMNAGNISQVGTPMEVYEHPADSFVASFIGTSNPLGDGSFLRPEELELTADSTADVSEPSVAKDGEWRGTVVHSAYGGGTYEVVVDVEGAPELWRVTHPSHLPNGQPVRLRRKA